MSEIVVRMSVTHLENGMKFAMLHADDVFGECTHCNADEMHLYYDDVEVAKKEWRAVNDDGEGFAYPEHGLCASCFLHKLFGLIE